MPSALDDDLDIAYGSGALDRDATSPNFTQEFLVGQQIHVRGYGGEWEDAIVCSVDPLLAKRPQDCMARQFDEIRVLEAQNFEQETFDDRRDLDAANGYEDDDRTLELE